MNSVHKYACICAVHAYISCRAKAAERAENLPVSARSEERGMNVFCDYVLGNTAEHAKGKALREDSIRQGIVGHSISDAGALI